MARPNDGQRPTGEESVTRVALNDERCMHPLEERRPIQHPSAPPPPTHITHERDTHGERRLAEPATVTTPPSARHTTAAPAVLLQHSISDVSYAKDPFKDPFGPDARLGASSKLHIHDDMNESHNPRRWRER